MNQLGPGFNAVDMTFLERLEKQVINDETQVRLARTMVGQRGARTALGQFQQQLLNKLEQVIDLLELAP